MHSNYYVNKYYAQDRIAAWVREAESYRLAQLDGHENGSGLALAAIASQAVRWINRVANRAGQLLEKLGEARVAPFYH